MQRIHPVIVSFASSAPCIYLAILILVLIAKPNSAADDLSSVRIRLVNGSSIRGNIKSIDSSGAIDGSRILDGIQLGQIVSIDTGQKSAATGKARIEIASGGFLYFDNMQLSDDQLLLQRNGNSLSLPVETIHGIVWQSSDTVEAAFEERSSEFDSVIVRTRKGEQRVDGIIDAIDETHVHLIFKGKTRKISRQKITALTTARLSENETAGIKANLIFTDGSKLSGVVQQFSNGIFSISISNSFELQISAGEIARVDIQSDRIRYLSDLSPIRYEAQSQFAAARDWQRDKSVVGNSIRLKYSSSGKIIEFDKGIGTRSFTSLVFENESDFDHFRSVVGLDMESGGQGDCEMVIEGDGIRLWSKRVTGRDDPEPIVVDIKGIKEVALVVLPGANFDLADHADWAEARFTKSR